MTDNTFVALVYLICAALGVRSSWRLTRLYRGARAAIERRNRPVLRVIVVAAWLITFAAIWIGGLSVIRIINGSTFAWTPPVTLSVALSIVLLPVVFDVVIARVTRDDLSDPGCEEPCE